jgi:septum formation protein
MMHAWQTAPLILASASASRRDMLTAVGLSFTIITADVDEAAIKAEYAEQGADPAAIALALARAKAEAVSCLHPHALVMGGDSIVSVGDKMVSKPRSMEDARQHLASFSGRQIILDSAGVLALGGTMIDAVSDRALLDVRKLSDAFVEAYLAAEWPAISACVGCFRMEGPGAMLFERVTGNHFTILGLPLLPVLAMFRRHGIVMP